jgi:hypothetical protein
MRITCPRCDHVITGTECDCGFHYQDRREHQPDLPLNWPPPRQMQTPQIPTRAQQPIFSQDGRR